VRYFVKRRSVETESITLSYGKIVVHCPSLDAIADLREFNNRKRSDEVKSSGRVSCRDDTL